MKERLLELVFCPECGDALRLEGAETEGGEVMRGELVCGRDHPFPIIGGIPRLLDRRMLCQTLRRYHPEEWSRLQPRLDEGGETPGEDTTSRTLSSFSYQWNTFDEMFDHWEENFRSYFEPLVRPADFDGKLVLDAGCGFGRHAYYAGTYGAEVVAMDLSEAVRAAFHNTRTLENVHVIQGNIYRPPVQPVFELIYCVGVIQHLPDPREGFSRLAGRLRPGGRIFVWVYGRRRGLYRLVDLMRTVTTRMSMASLHRLTWLLNLVSYGVFCVPHRMARALPGLWGLAHRIPFTRYADLPLRVGHADWFDRLAVPSTVYFGREEVASWFEASGLSDRQISSRDGIGWRAVGAATAAETRPSP